MSKTLNACPKKHQQAFFEAQKKVDAVLRPFRFKSLNQYFTDGSVIETFAVYDKKADEDGRHKWCGIVSVWYGYPIAGDKQCTVAFNFDEGMLARAMGSPVIDTWEATTALVEKVLAMPLTA